MSPPNPYITLSRLQVALAPLEYQTLIRRYSARWGGFDLSDAGDDFCQHMPRYRIAVCPFCGHEYAEPLNTYGLHGWITQAHQGVYVLRDFHRWHCQHVVAVNVCINFNGFVPNELNRIKVRTDVSCRV